VAIGDRRDPPEQAAGEHVAGDEQRQGCHSGKRPVQQERADDEREQPREQEHHERAAVPDAERGPDLEHADRHEHRADVQDGHDARQHRGEQRECSTHDHQHTHRHRNTQAWLFTRSIACHDRLPESVYAREEQVACLSRPGLATAREARPPPAPSSTLERRAAHELRDVSGGSGRGRGIDAATLFPAGDCDQRRAPRRGLLLSGRAVKAGLTRTRGAELVAAAEAHAGRRTDANCRGSGDLGVSIR